MKRTHLSPSTSIKPPILHIEQNILGYTLHRRSLLGLCFHFKHKGWVRNPHTFQHSHIYFLFFLGCCIVHAMKTAVLTLIQNITLSFQIRWNKNIFTWHFHITPCCSRSHEIPQSLAFKCLVNTAKRIANVCREDLKFRGVISPPFTYPNREQAITCNRVSKGDSPSPI